MSSLLDGGIIRNNRCEFNTNGFDRLGINGNKLNRTEDNSIEFYMPIRIHGETEIILEILVFFTIMFLVNIPDNAMEITDHG